MNLMYDQISDRIKMRDVISMYVCRVDGASGRIQCPIHNGHDKNFSYAPEVWHCWSCGAKGNVITFVAQLYGISNYEAVKKIDSDFNLNIVGKKPSMSAHRKARKRKEEQERNEQRILDLKRKHDTQCGVHAFALKMLEKDHVKNNDELFDFYANEAINAISIIEELEAEIERLKCVGQ